MATQAPSCQFLLPISISIATTHHCEVIDPLKASSAQRRAACASSQRWSWHARRLCSRC